MRRIFLALTFLFLLPALAVANDSVFSPGPMGWAVRDNAEVQDLDYSKNFSVEILVYIAAHTRHGRNATHIAKGPRNAAVGKGWSIHTGFDIYENYSKPVYFHVSDGTNSADVYTSPYQGYAYLVMTWDAVSKTLTGYRNGLTEKNETTNSSIMLSDITNTGSLRLAANGLYDMPNAYGATNSDKFFARMWNRKLSDTEVDSLYENWQTTGGHTTPPGFDRSALISEWLMDSTVDSNGNPGSTHLKDNIGNNHLEIKDSAIFEEEPGLLGTLYPEDGASGIGASTFLKAKGGRGSLNNPTLPLQYFFQIDEVASFDSPALKESGWKTHYSEWQPILKPDTTYYWHVKVRNSSEVPTETNYTSIISFTTRQVKNWYVRPYQNIGTYGNEDGSSYANAWNGLVPITYNSPAFDDKHGIQWGPGGVEAGDTLYICGEHILNHTLTRNANMTGKVYVTIDGFSDDYPVTIRMDAAEESGIVWGFSKSANAPYDWKGPDANGVYSTNAAISTPLFADPGTENAQFLLQESSTSWTGNLGYWYKLDGTTYVKMPDGNSPADRIFENQNGYQILATHRKHILFKNCDFRGYYFEDDTSEGELPRSTYLVWDGCTMQYGGPLITLHRYNDHWTVRNCTLKKAASAIYAYNRPDYLSADNAIIENNTITDLGVDANGYSDGDNHAVGVQGCSNWIIQKNHIENTGTAVAFWNGVGEGKYMRNNIIRWNFIKDTNSMGVTLGDGIKISGSNGATLGLRTGFQVYGNIIIDTDGYGIGSNNPDPVMVYNNLIYGTKNHSIREDISSSNYPPAISIKNNIIIEPGARFIQLSGDDGGAANWDDVHIDNNLYYPDANVNGKFYAQKYGSKSYADWVVNTPFDHNSLTVDPELNISGSFSPSHIMLLPNAPMVDAGTDVGLQMDYLGAPIPYGNAPDIGPFEYPGASYFLPPPTNFRVLISQ